MLDTVKQVGIRILIGLVAFGIIIMGIAAGLASMITASASGSSSYSASTSGVTDLGSYIVKTDEQGAMPAMSKEELKKAIDTCYSGQTHDNLISTLDDFISVQNQYKINAAFMVAITIIESSGGTAWDAINPETHNWMSVSWGEKWNGAEGKTQPNGEHTWCWYSSFSEAVQKFGIYLSSHDWAYFTAGKYSVSEIAPTYCNEQWGTSIKAELDKLYSAAGVSVASSGTYSGATYTYAGRTYTIFEQWDDRYKNYPFGVGNIWEYGCGVTSVATVVSGYKSGEDPTTITDRCKKYGYTYETNLSTQMFPSYLSEYGLTGSYVGPGSEQEVVKHLKGGKPVIVNIKGVLSLDGQNSKDYSGGHYITALGLDENGHIFIGEPGGPEGTISIENLKTAVGAYGGYLLVNEK